MSTNMAQLARRLPSNDLVLQGGATPPLPLRDTNSIQNIPSQNLAQSASTDPPQDLDFRRVLLAKETQLIEVERLKLRLELARIQALSNSTISNESNPAKLPDTAKSLGDLRTLQRTLYPHQWLHILAPGEPKISSTMN